MSYGNPAQEEPVSSSSQLPVPATGQQIATQKPSKASRMLRGPIGRDQILEWQASLCCLTPLGTCFRPQSSGTIYCSIHTCQAINVDRERCGNAVHNPRQSRFCSNGWHVENSKYDNIVEMVTKRKQLDEANAARRKQEMTEQMALFKSQFSPLSSTDKTSSSSNQSSQLFMSNPQTRKQNGFQMRW
ncbi:hypothetical protein CNA02335 [Cryptococcus deneoformans JEC21]|uniref:Uncharacterized protein n=1 Tax=Cryptococcus deneoformans (strain JEC21 / ATCC MYA-565) TaxID=214684 RepID=A0A0S2LHW5_CRYD1|nr:hypothetical protein CNA02335 [Cryptococcus neoformans var. neoformans JEC21]ALO60304.1 hypothetical protein CNA02335 [Cryptococcus neoformans var. neoformans JEC21]